MEWLKRKLWKGGARISCRRVSCFLLIMISIVMLTGFVSTTDAAISFMSGVEYPSSGNYGDPFAITSGDFNNDGYPDIAFVETKDHNLYILLNNGNGTFTKVYDVKVDKKPQGITCGDLNNDGKLDIVASRYDGDNVRVYLGNGNGTFTYKADFSVKNAPVGVALAHLNSDNYLDLIVCNSGDKSFSVLTGKGDGTFNSSVRYATNVNTPWAVSVGDFNNDGNPDVVIAHNSDDKKASIFSNNGSGVFTKVTDVSVYGKKSTGVAIGDFDRDGDIDFATGDHDGKSVSVCMNNGTGTSFPMTSYTHSSLEHIRGIVAADFDGDGDLDISMTNDHDNEVIILENNGSGIFSFVGSGFPVNSHYPRGITTADFDKNGLPDLATANTDGHNISVLINSGTPPAPATYSISGTVSLIGGGNVQEVLLTLSGASSRTANPDASGLYSFTGLSSGDYTVTPSLENHEFTPASRNYTSLNSNQTGQDFLGIRQYNLTINSDYDTPNPENGTHTYDFGDIITCSVQYEIVTDGGTRYVCTGYTLDGNTVYGETSVDITMDSNHTLTWNWKIQYYLTVNSDRGNPQGEGWYDAGATASWSVTSPVVNGGTKYIASQASGSVTMNSPETVNVQWSTYYYLTTIADPQSGGTVTPDSGWYEAGSNVQIQAFPNQAWIFSAWSGDISGSQNPLSIVMNGPKTGKAIFTALVQNTISGKVYKSNGSAFPAVTIEYNGTWNGQNFSGSLITGTDGSYSISIPKGWTGTVMPKNTSSQFTPASRSYTSISANQTNQDFTALGGYTISGYIRTSTGQPIVGVIVNLGGYGTCTTGTTGYYTKTVPAGWSGTVTLYRPGYKFTPISRTYSNVLKNYSNQNFTGTL